MCFNCRRSSGAGDICHNKKDGSEMSGERALALEAANFAKDLTRNDSGSRGLFKAD